MSTNPEHRFFSTRAELVAYLAEDSVPHKVDPDGGRVLIPIDKDGLRSTLAILWNDQQSLVQLILGLPFPVPEGTRSEVWEAIGRANHVLAMPGFGFDPDAGFLYYRLVQPRRRDGTLSAGDIQRLFATVTRTAAQFHRALFAVADGQAPGAKVLELTKPSGQ